MQILILWIQIWAWFCRLKRKENILRFHLYSDYKPIVFNGKITRRFLYGHKNYIHSKWLTYLNSHLDCPYWVQNMDSYFENVFMCEGCCICVCAWLKVASKWTIGHWARSKTLVAAANCIRIRLKILFTTTAN